MQAAEAGNIKAAWSLEYGYRKGKFAATQGNEATCWKERHAAIQEQWATKCPRSAYGIKELSEAGWINQELASKLC
jgi:hypothetical protein